MLYRQFAEMAWLKRVFVGIAAAAAGLILGMGIKLAAALPRKVWAGGDRARRARRRRRRAPAAAVGGARARAARHRSARGSGAVVNGDPTWPFAAHLALLSIVSVGGAHAMLPDIYRFVVIEHSWLGGQEFATLVALSQAAPGPNVLVTTLLGYQIGGLLARSSPRSRSSCRRRSRCTRSRTSTPAAATRRGRRSCSRASRRSPSGW